jgi:hypothetical protein
VIGLAVMLDVGVPGSASAQVPIERQPRATVPTREGVIQTAAPAAPAPAAAPVTQPPGQPTTAPAAAPTEPAPVSAVPPPSGVTQVPPAAAPPATSSSSAAATAKDARSYSSANFALSLDGMPVGSLRSAEGGAAVADVVVEKVGEDHVAKKHVAGVKYEELSFEVGFDAKPVTDWVASTWKGSFARKNGSLQLADFNYNVHGERQFTNALITGTTIPALDAASKDAAYLKVTIAPEYVREMAGSGKAQTSMNKGMKQWRASNFRLVLGELETTRVHRIESFTVGQKVIESPVGEMRDYEKQAGTLVFPNLKITMAEVSSPSWAKWHDEFVIKGNSGEAQEKNGAIVFLDNAMKDELGRINLFNCGIFRFGAAPLEANRDRAAQVVADLYCERMELAIGNSGK